MATHKKNIFLKKNYKNENNAAACGFLPFQLLIQLIFNSDSNNGGKPYVPGEARAKNCNFKKHPVIMLIIKM